ncbi:hypothetical protein KKF81_02625 [Candidatus Micrarchaeota archaeon]|nr:hypothetical protein [Candidatus Micrarchaeota archaeon]MBU1887511.1 hypothetical protein [Candidatus Micrarchaeota archaeon]
MSRIYYKEISLFDMIKESTYILIVKRKFPSESEQSTKLVNGPATDTISYYFKIIKELYNKPKDKLPDVIAVFPAYQTLHKLLATHYYQTGEIESPVLYSYSPKTNRISGEMIIFLAGSYEFVVENAHESILKKDDVIRIIKKVHTNNNC